MNTDYLKYFVTLTQIKHFGKAAERLYITQPNLSYAISSLEKELGKQLFIRSNKTVALTNDGMAFLPYAERIIQDLKAGVRAMNASYTEDQLIRLGFSQTFFLPQILKPFNDLYSDQHFTFSLCHQSTSQIIRDLKGEALDLGFCYYSQSEDELEYIPVQSSKLVLIVPNRHPLAAFDEVDLSETIRYPLICSSREPFLQHFIKDMYYTIGLTPQFFCETETVSAAANLVSNNLGIAIVGDYPMLKNYPVKRITIRSPQHTLLLALCYLKHAEKNVATLEFIRYVRSISPPHLPTSEILAI